MASTALPIETQSNGSAIHPDPVNKLSPTSIDSLPSSSSTIKTPLLHPSKGSIFPPPASLTPDQSAKYDTLLSTATSWTDIPTSSAAKSPTTPLADADRMWLTRECLLRYLRAAKWSLPDATKRLVATVIWRREYFDPTHNADYFSHENETGKAILYGWDKAGRTCLYLNPAAQNTSDQDMQTEHLFFMMERCIEVMLPGQETVVMLINFKNLMQSPKVGLGRAVLKILQTHYPERLGLAMTANVGWLIWTFLKLINPFIDPTTREKIKHNEKINQYVPSEQLLKDYGGEVDFVYDHQVYWPALLEFAATRREEYTARWVRGGKRIGESERYLRGGEERGVGGQDTSEDADVQGEANRVVQ